MLASSFVSNTKSTRQKLSFFSINGKLKDKPGINIRRHNCKVYVWSDQTVCRCLNYPKLLLQNICVAILIFRAENISESCSENTPIYYKLPSTKRRPGPLLNHLYYFAYNACILSPFSSIFECEAKANNRVGQRPRENWRRGGSRRVGRNNFPAFPPVSSVICLSKLGPVAGS